MPTLPLFSSINVSSYPAQLEAQLHAHRQQIDKLLASSHTFTWDQLILPLEQLDNALACFWSPLAHLHAVINTAPNRRCYEACLPLLSAHESAITQHKALYDALLRLKNTPLNPEQKKILNDRLRDFTLAGVNLTPSKKERFKVIDARLSELANQFENNLLDAEAAFELHLLDETRLNGLPEHAKRTARLAAEQKKQSGWLLLLNQPTYLAVLTYAKDRALRKAFYQAYHTRASDIGPSAHQFDNTPVLIEILTLRHELARLLDFSHYADYSLATKMVNSTTEVLNFLNDLVSRTTSQAKDEYQALCEFAHTNGHLHALEPWDTAYFSLLKKQQDHALDDEQLRAYFPLTRVMQGLLKILHSLFAIELREVTPVDTWHADVRCYALYDHQQTLRGYLYCDLFARANKRGGAWMDSLKSRWQDPDGVMQLPIATLTCNFANTATDGPATLSHDEVITLLHEMGHCLHHLLTQVDYLSASGLHGLEWDAVELPSQLLENWAWTNEGLALLSAHIDTDEALPLELLKQLLASKTFQAAIHLLRQLELALFDLQVHILDPGTSAPLRQSIDDLLARIQQHTRVMPHYPDARLAQSFSHIFAGGYAAGYYSYLWAEVLSDDAFALFKHNGVLNAET